MAGDYAQMRRDIWGDSDWTDLSPMAQWLYWVITTDPKIELTGVADWRPKRMLKKAAALTVDLFEAAAEELQAKAFIVVDEDTEEVMIRTYVKHDDLLKSPNMGRAIARLYPTIASKTLRGVLVHELHKLRDEQPDLKGFPALSQVMMNARIDARELVQERFAA